MQILMRILPQFFHLLENQNFYFWSQNCQLTMFYLSHQSQMCDNFQSFGHHIEMFLEKSYQLFGFLGIYTDKPWMPGPDPAK